MKYSADKTVDYLFSFNRFVKKKYGYETILDVIKARSFDTIYMLRHHYYYRRYKDLIHVRDTMLTNNKLDTININSCRLQITNSEYLRLLIHNAVPAAVDYRQDIAPVICKIDVRLQELGLDEKEITKEVHALLLPSFSYF